MIQNTKIREWYYSSKNYKKNEIAKILGVEYAHVKLKNEGDLYITRQGLPFIENLRPEGELWVKSKNIQSSLDYTD
jgi:hypothetical protein